MLQINTQIMPLLQKVLLNVWLKLRYK